MKTIFSTLLILFLFVTLQAQEITLDYYLPEGVQYNEDIPTPFEVLNQEVGEWHVRHDQLVQYMYAVAEASDRVSIVEYARSYENRPLLSLVFTSPENHANLEEIRREHLALGDASISGDMDISGMPVVVRLSYTVHGNEPSTGNSAMLTVYHLAAAEGPEIEELLDNAVVLVDPAMNPDGLNRFANWVNSHKSLNTLVTDGNSREFNEVWPGGRTNHYWFDLNRDWMLVQHPESRGKIKRFQEWKPNILTDHHEMGTNSTFFFQPGIPSRTHPLTPARNQLLTGSIAEYHAEEFDKIQSLYYSKESFDDFYYGKGSTYPDIQGSIGILFEQSSSRGHAQESVHGILKFPFTIKNQFVASQSTLKAAIALREELLEHYRTFYLEAAEEADRANIKAYIFGESADQARTFHLAEMLNYHNIEVYELATNASADGKDFESGKAYVVPTNQQQYKLITAMFEVRTTFPDSLFYDVSAWTMPYAFNLPYTELNAREYNENMLGERFTGEMKSTGELVGGRSNYAYAFEWDEYYAPRALYRLMSAGVRTKVATLQFSGVTREGQKNFGYGTIMVPLGLQDNPDEVHDIIQTIAEEDNIKVYTLNTGLSSGGIDLGSNNFDNLEMPKVAVVGGSGTNPYEIGEMWHLFDQRYHMPLSIVEKDDLDDLDKYNVIIMTGYNLNDISGGTVNELKTWVRNGGVLITMKQAIGWANRQEMADVEFVSNNGDEEEDVETRPYIKQSADRGAQVIGGAIFNAKLDLTHPLGYGYNDENITVFRNSTIFLEKGENPYSTPLYYTNSPLASGYVSDENVERMAGTASIVVSSYGGGRVIAMTDNPNFRAFWYGTNKLFANAVFFGQTIRGSSGN